MKVHLIHDDSFEDYTTGLRLELGKRVELVCTTITSDTPRISPRPIGAAHWQLGRPRTRSPKSLLYVPAFRGHLARYDADLVHLQATANPWSDLTAAYLRPSTPLVVTVHDLDPHPGDPGTFSAAFKALRSLARRADRLIVHSTDLRARAIELGVDSSHVHVLPHGELGSVIRRQAAAARPGSQSSPLAPSQQPHSVLFFGRVHGYKGLEVLLRAMTLVRQHIPAAHLTVAGRGDELDRLLPAGHALPEGVRVIRGRLDPQIVEGLFSEAAVVALPYLEASQSGVAALAAGMGRACVASGVGGLPELVRHDESGIIVPPGSASMLASALLDVLGDAPLRRRLESGALAQARTHLSWDDISGRTVDIYRAAVEQSEGSPPSNARPFRRHRRGPTP